MFLKKKNTFIWRQVLFTIQWNNQDANDSATGFGRNPGRPMQAIQNQPRVAAFSNTGMHTPLSAKLAGNQVNKRIAGSV